ncbi:MAG TPA: hypothetical protein VGQ76_07345 [Thermoanaerobaculia bacterium]|jgi:hypothetical protein|nr:hypothetical protein [Thermoanaerobaculia bacterium]
MKSTLRIAVLAALALVIAVPAAYAQTPEASTLPVNEPLDVGGTILQPGVYTIRVLPSLADRHKVQITSQDLQTVYATVLTVPHPILQNEEPANSVFVYYPAGEGMPAALRTWFAPDPDASGGGHDIVYSQSRAQQLARLGNSRVVAYPTETIVADLDTTPLSVVTPESTVEVYTVPPPAPVAIAETTPAPMISSETTRTETTQIAEATTPEMPSTASKVPFIALFGLLSLGGAVAFRLARR